MKFGEKVVKYRRLILIISILLLIPSVLGYLNTRINYDMLTYLPGNMETVKGQNLLMEEFDKGGFTIVVTEGMSRQDVHDLAEKYRKIDHVSSVLNVEEVIDPAIPIGMYPEQIQETFQDPDASMVCVFFDASTSDEASLNALMEIRSISTKQCYASGMTALVQDLKALCEKEEPKYVGIAVLLSLAAMMILLDSFAAPVIFLLSIGMAIIYNLGSNIFFGEIAYITKAIAAVLQLGVTMDYSIFVWHAYVEKLDLGKSREEAMASAVNDALAAVTGSSITTVAGFLALCAMSYTMGFDLGIVMAKGVVLGVICSVTVLPAMILACHGLLIRTRHPSVIPDMTGFAKKLTGRYTVFLVIFAILFLPAVYGYHHENITYDFTNMLSGNGSRLPAEQIPFKTANEKLYEHFGINTTHIIIADGGLERDKGYAMSEEIRKVDGVSSVLGLDEFLGTAVPVEVLPDEVRSALVSGGGHQMILVNSEYKKSTEECNDQIDTIEGILDRYDKSATLIGEGAATKDLISLTSSDFRIVNIISIVAVFLIIFFVLRSWLLPVLLILAIEFAIYVNLGIPGYTGLEMAFLIPVLISTIQLGSTVDYAILMSTRYKKERMSGKERRDAVQAAAAASIPSILVSGLGFFTATFGVGIYSNIGIISTVCGLMARGALISMATVILVLPSMLMAFDRPICLSTKGMGHLVKKMKKADIETGEASV